jgi:hypothetical protein
MTMCAIKVLLASNSYSRQGSANAVDIQGMRFSGRRGMVDVEVEDQRSAWTEQPLGFTQGPFRVIDVVEAVAREHNIDALSGQGEILSTDRQIQRWRVRKQQTTLRELLGERLDSDAHASRTRIREAKQSGANVHNYLAVEEVAVLNARLCEDAMDFSASLLPAPAHVVGFGLLALKELQRVRRKEATSSQHWIPLLDPPPEFRLALERSGVAKATSEAKLAANNSKDAHGEEDR